MAGYDGFSMSNNARQAYADGERPMSKWTKTAILSRAAEVMEDCYSEPTFDFSLLRSLSVSALRDLLLSRVAYHHTSSWYNATDFYDIEPDTLEELTDEAIKAAANAPKTKPESPASERWECAYLVWEGTRKHPKARRIVETGTICGNWFFSDTGMRKQTTANGFERIRRIEDGKK